MKNNFFILLLLLFISCGKNQKPKGIMERDLYKSILKEIVIANAMEQQLLSDSISFSPMQLVYNKFNIDSLKLKKTTDYYTQHPEILNKIYTEINSELKKIVDSLEKINPKIKKQKNQTQNTKTQNKINISTNIIKKGSVKKILNKRK